MAFQATEEQRSAIEDRGGCTLVSAAAGSGKTKVLVERLLARVQEGHADIDRFLVITYTNAAAAELRRRIAEELSVRLAQTPGDSHLRRQAALVYKAQISTVHAFCMALLRENGHLADLDPDFRLCEEQEANLIALQTLNDVLDRRYEELEGEGDFSLLVDVMSAGRDDQRLIQIVLDVRGRVQSHPDPAAWLAQQEEAFALGGVTDARATVWGRFLLSDAARQASYWRGRMEEALALTQWDEKLAANYAESLRATIEGLERFCAAATEGWDAARAALPIPFPPAGRKKVECREEAERLKAIRSAGKDRLERMSTWFADGSAGLLGDMRAVFPAVRGLFALVRDFEAAYTAEKRRRGLLDFSDLEHLAVGLLVDGQGRPTALARRWSERYDEIMVDEYQDTNAVQNAIFSAVSRDEKNLFLVGDVKQSIYRFRLADPTLFLDRYRTFPPRDAAAEGEGRKIILSRNFRSRVQVLEGVNYLFRNLMSEEFGEMDYDADAVLRPGRQFPPVPAEDASALELDVLDLSGVTDGEEEKPANYLLEARHAARRIRELVEGGFPVTEGETTRPATYGDVVVLLRSPGSVFHHYARALGELDIPWEAEAGADFFAATEVQVALSLLEILDNPRQDVPLISALRSPVYGFSADRLAQLRAAAPEGDFYTALERAAERGEADCVRFLTELEELRGRAGEGSCYRLLWEIYDRTNLLGMYGALEEGELRQSNLLALTELARRFEEAGHRGLFGFLAHLTRLREKGERLDVPGLRPGGGGVRILSIHRSKGLEFPIVLLCGLSRRLNREDMQRPILFHPRLGVGPKRLDLERMLEYPTLARMAVARKLEYEMMAEELRLLYVAMTRAQDKLILTCALPRGERELKRLAGDAACPVEPQVLAACQSVGQWVLLSALARPDAGALHRAAGVAAPASAAEFGPAWDIRYLDAAVYRELPRRRAYTPRQAAQQLCPDGELLRKYTWRYPYSGASGTPSKLTATQLKGRAVDQEIAEDAAQSRRSAARTGNTALRRPRFAEEEFGLTPAQRGTAQHLVMQFIDFDRTASREEIQEEIARLTAKKIITPQQGEAASAERIYAFFTSPLGRELRAAPTLRREFKFSILVDAAEYWPEAEAGEQVLLQGVVDCCFETPAGLTVVDFKTDRVSDATVAKRAEEYRPQLEAYARALEEVTGKRVDRRVLWFFALDRAVEL